MRRFLDFVARVVPYQMSARLDHFSNHKKFHQPFKGPMNGQTARLEIVRELIESFGVERIVETGTFRGSTTEWFSTFGIPVVTMEVIPRFAEFARIRLKKARNVRVLTTNSVDGLAQLIAEGGDLDVPTLFYLDAHWYDYLPLRREYELIVANFARPIIVIDDFQVPDDPGYEFAAYESGSLTLDYLIEPGDLLEASVFFPRTKARWETGAKSGYVVVTTDAAIAAAMRAMPLLRPWQVEMRQAAGAA
jgi:predicted O-methyltransferase YrrM